MSYEDLEPTAARDLLDQEPDLVVLDVRTAPEFVRHRIAGAVLIPVQELAMRTAELDPARRHLVVCEHGVRSVAACQILAANGFEQCSNLRGGMARWVGEGLPFEAGAPGS